jgi:paraquat-inducible protein B
MEIIKYFFTNTCKKKKDDDILNEPLPNDGKNGGDNVEILEHKNRKSIHQDLGKEKYLYIIEKLEPEETIDPTLDDNIYKKVKEQLAYFKKMELKIKKNLDIVKENQKKIQIEIKNINNNEQMKREIKKSNDDIIKNIKEEMKKQINEEMNKNNKEIRLQLNKMEEDSNNRIDKLEKSFSSLDQLIRGLIK